MTGFDSKRQATADKLDDDDIQTYQRPEGQVSELTEASLGAMLIEIRKHLDETGDRVSLIPTQLILRPSDLEALGLTVDDVIKMVKEKA
jgi:regulator of sirC expression with transglutaminase-like and TPR domain